MGEERGWISISVCKSIGNKYVGIQETGLFKQFDVFLEEADIFLCRFFRKNLPV